MAAGLDRAKADLKTSVSEDNRAFRILKLRYRDEIETAARYVQHFL